MNRDELLKLLEEINEPEYRRAFVEGHAKDTIAFQIRQLRNARDWEQRDLARELGNPKLQPMISRYENPDYGRYSISTLLDLAAAFDVALVVRFAPFSELVEWDLKATSKTLCPAPYAKDKALGTLSSYASGGTRLAGLGGIGGRWEDRASLADPSISAIQSQSEKQDLKASAAA
jgi:transcriptional regulator with XRE-family HTH domain